MLFVGTERAEARSCRKPVASKPYRPISAAIKQVIGAGRLKAGLARRKDYQEFKPDVVLGTGSYVTPVVLAVLARRPAVIHEQMPCGLSNQLLAPLVSRVCLSFC